MLRVTESPFKYEQQTPRLSAWEFYAPDADVLLACWQETELYVWLRWLDEPGNQRFKLMLDLDNDGWFAGADNYQIEVDEQGQATVKRHVADSATDWPYVDAEPFSASLMDAAVAAEDGELTLSLRIARAYFPELAAKPGEVIGFNVGMAREGENWYYMLGEPNTLMPIELR
jgi:hypothetical protein